MDRQRAKQRTTKAEVIRHMRGMSAVNTTHGLIMDLVKEGKLNVEELNSQVHFLSINENYDLPQFERELLVQKITEVHSYFENITPGNEGLIAFLIQSIIDDDLRPEIRFFVPNLYKIIIKEKARPEAQMIEVKAGKPSARGYSSYSATKMPKHKRKRKKA
jgi:hypothetical protein